MFDYVQLIKKESDALAACITSDNGKTTGDAKGIFNSFYWFFKGDVFRG